jgi:hypothetical protein
MFALSLKHKAMSELTVSKSVGNLRIETDFHDLMIRVYQAGNVIHQIDCHDMSLAEYDLTITRVIAEMNDKRKNNKN